jgi:hypothetical protein
MASLYFWAGFFKLTSPLFHSHTAPFTFKRIFSLLRVRDGSRWQYALSSIAVAAEMVSGVVFFMQERLPAGLVYAFACFIFFMHTYIVVFIGLDNSIHTFAPWNAMCVALTSLLFGVRRLDPDSCALKLHPHHFILLAVLHAPPILQLLGKNEYGTLSHSWFVPSASGCCFLLVPASISSSVPAAENGAPIPRLRDPALRSDASSHLTSVKSDAQALFGIESDACSRVLRQMVQESIFIDGEWVSSLLLLFL